MFIILNALKYYKKYTFLVSQLISRDFKVKYKRSVLGILWSLLNPMLSMLVMALVFSNFFKMRMEGVNYLVYLMTGLVIFNYFSEASTAAMGSIVYNFGLINKVYIPKYIFPIEKVLFTAINLVLSLIPLYLVVFFTGGSISAYHLLLPFVLICLILFTLGIGFLLATLAVFLRDIFYIYGILISLWTYLTPIMYDIGIVSENIQVILKLNPLYQFIDFAREIILFNRMPSTMAFIACALYAIVFLVLGVIVFKKNHDKFIYFA